MNKFNIFLISAILVLSVFTSSDIISNSLGISLLFIFCTILFISNAISEQSISFPIYPILFIISILILQTVHIINSNVDTSSLNIRPAYTSIFLIVSLIIIPCYIKIDHFLWVVSRLSAIFVLVGIPSLIIGEYQIGVLQVQITHYASPFIFSSFVDLPRIPLLYSVFSNPNSLGGFLITGCLSSLYLYDKFESRVYSVLFTINFVGLYLTNSKTSIIAVIVGVAIFLFLKRFNDPRILNRLLDIGIVLIFVSTPLLLFNTGLIVDLLSGNLTNRTYLWTGTVRAASQSPIIGSGLVNPNEAIAPYITVEDAVGSSPHNAYLLTLLRTGIIGLAIYISFLFYVVFAYIRTDNESYALLYLVVPYLMHHSMEIAGHLFSMSEISLLFSILLGYMIREGARSN